MSEHLADVLVKTAGVLHWFGRWTESNACILLSRLVRLRDLKTLEELEAFVMAEEAKEGTE